MKKVVFALLLLAAACGKKDDPTPTPTATQAAFMVRLVNEVNEPVALINNSTGGTRYEWDFGNGQNSTVAAPTAVYATPGTYTITLRSYNSANQVSMASLAVRIGKRYLKSVSITALPFTNPTGQPWQSSGGPNIYMRFVAPGGTINTTTANNFQPSMLPFTYTITSNVELQQGSTWQFALYNYNAILADDLMSNWALPIGAPTSNRDAAGSGSYTLTGPASAPASYNILVNYETR